jgi:ABC-type multidrug transport system fused ATPase/permease subunit
MKINYYKKFINIIPLKYKYLFVLFILVLIIGLFFQLVGISLLIPLSSTFFGNSNFESIKYLEVIKNIFPALDQFSNFFLYLTFTVVFIIVSNLIFLLSAYLSSSISFSIERDIKIMLYKHYLHGYYLNFFKTETSDLLSLLINETQRVSSQVLMPLADIISRLFILSGILSYLIYLMPKEYFLGIVLFFFLYFFFFILIKKRIQLNNIILSSENKQLVKITNNLFKSFKEIKIYCLENNILNKIILSAEKIKEIKFFTNFFSNFPRYLIEIILFLLIYFLIFFQENTVNIFIEKYLLVIIYCLFKVLPSIQGVFSLLFVVNSNLNSVDEIFYQLKKSKFSNKNINLINTDNKFNIFNSLKLKNISFKFNKKIILNNINIEILNGDKIGIEGESGSGKSTLINIISGLLKKNSGKIYLNNKEINSQKLLNFSRFNIGYISQNPSILEGTIKENIILDKEYNKEYFYKCIEISGLKFVLKNLKGFDQKIHGSNSNLSGGQIQRVLIARALYRKPKLIFIDEGFSQLDKTSEIEILNKMLKIQNITIIMIYHKISNKAFLNKIYKFNNKKIILKKND